MKNRVHRLIGYLNGRYTGRENGYVMSPSKVKKLETLYAAGYDADYGIFEKAEGKHVMAKRKPSDAWANTPEGIAKYQRARAEAQRLANELGFDYALERNDLFKSFQVYMLPMKANRSGHELRASWRDW
jgi:hypothetical protein